MTEQTQTADVLADVPTTKARKEEYVAPRLFVLTADETQTGPPGPGDGLNPYT